MAKNVNGNNNCFTRINSDNYSAIGMLGIQFILKPNFYLHSNLLTNSQSSLVASFEDIHASGY